MQSEHTHAFFSHDSTGVSCQAVFWSVLLLACSAWPVCDKGMWRAEEEKKKKAFKVVFGVPALPSQQAADFL